MPNRNNNLVVEAARRRLQELKFEIASQLGPMPERVQTEDQFRGYMNKFKYEVAAELGIPLQHSYNGHLTSRQAGQIGGRLGGHIGGHMVRSMIRLAESSLSGQTPTE